MNQDVRMNNGITILPAEDYKDNIQWNYKYAVRKVNCNKVCTYTQLCSRLLYIIYL